MSYRDDIRAIRQRLHAIEGELLPIHNGVASAEAATLIGRSMAMVRATDHLLGGCLAERLDIAPADRLSA